MSRCVKKERKYQEPGQGVGVGFCHSCHSVKMRKKHLDLLESSRGPPHHIQTNTWIVSDHTYRWGSFVINDFSNLTKSLSPTPELQYTRDSTCEYVHSRCTCSKKLGSRKESIQFKGQKEWNPDMHLCWYGCIMIQF